MDGTLLRSYRLLSSASNVALVLSLVGLSDAGAVPFRTGGSRLNEFTAGEQEPAAVAALDDGFVVAWSSYPSWDDQPHQDGSLSGVYARLLDRNGRPASPEFRLNETTQGSQFSSCVVAVPNGFVAVWLSETAVGSKQFRAVMRRFDQTGAAATGEVFVDPHPDRSQEVVSCAASPSGQLLLAWVSHWPTSLNTDESATEAGWFDSFLQELGVPIAISPARRFGEPAKLAVAAREGSSLVAWNNWGERGVEILACQLGDPRAPATCEPQIVSRSGKLWWPLRLAARGRDGWWLSFYSAPPGADEASLFALPLGKNGGAAAPALRLKKEALGDEAIRLVAAPDGTAVVVWEGAGYNPTPLLGQRLDTIAGLLGRSFRVGSAALPLYKFAPNYQPSLAISSRGILVAAYPTYCAGSRDEVGVQTFILPREGDDPCWLDGGLLVCDVLGETRAPFLTLPIEEEGELLLGDLDGDGADDPCRYSDGVFRCNTAHRTGRIQSTQLAWRRGDRPLIGDPNGDGRDDLCLRRARSVLCDTAHDGGSAELVLRFGGIGEEILFADVDGNGADEACRIDATGIREVLACDLGHDGGAAEWSQFVPTPGAVLLGDLQGDGRDDVCVVDQQTLRCDVDADGELDLERVLPASATRIMLGELQGS